ncbi:four-carbon acid sugar kinase family protein [Brachybacterium tyrofermentans]|uniref:four-carbon acid sugar kinase family protein n=1 Tax=Brachybacterium tyrofermentans TaxID=47848 RepID=UPI001D01DC97|nr:four-carbon acid sugar kinase family protein [Brachybacterium tyrofermentans]
MAGSRRLLVLDDDPTGSQCVAGIDVAFDLDPAIPAEVLTEPGSTCFVLTNTRALDEADAVCLNRRLVAGVLADPVAREGLHVVSRSDSTLRGHVIAEPVAIADELAAHDVAVDAILLVPAMLEAGRYTEGDVHYAVVDGVPRRVEDTDFARDATFGYTRSDLREFLEERSGGAVRAADVLSIGLDDIRTGGVGRVHEILAAARDRRWVVVNATEYSDMEVVAEAVSLLEAEGRTLITRCGPSFVRPLAGQSGAQVVDPASITIPAGRLAHGLVVVGSHVGLTTTQLRAVQERGTLVEVELHVPSLLDDRREQHLGEVVERLRAALQEDDCVLYTSRDLVRSDDPAESLAIARSVSDAVVEVVRRVRSVKPAWVVAKGGITSHEVAANGLGIRRARVEGQFWPGQVSLFSAQEAPEEVMGAPYVVFPGNVGGEQALADVVDRLAAAVAAVAPAPDAARAPATIGWIGLGAMGAPMVRTAGAAGFAVRAFDLSPDAREAVADAATPVNSALEAATAADVVVVMVATPAQLESVLLGEGTSGTSGSSKSLGTSTAPGASGGIVSALTADTTLLIMSTVGPAAIEATVTALEGITTHVVDAPVSGGVARAGTGDLLIMVGGAEPHVATVRPLLDALAANAPVVGPRPGDGQRFKVVNQLLCGVHIAAAGEALALADSMGLDLKQVHEVLNTGAAASFMFGDRGGRMVEGARDDAAFDEVRSALSIFVKDMGLVSEAAREVGQEVPLAASAEGIYQRGSELGHDRKDDSIVFDVLRGEKG